MVNILIHLPSNNNLPTYYLVPTYYLPNCIFITNPKAIIITNQPTYLPTYKMISYKP